MASLVLSDGTRSYDFLAEPRPTIYVQQEGINLPVVTDENTYAEGSDSEGRSRIRSRATNSEAGSFSVFFKATTGALFWDAVDNLQELVLSAHRNKGTLAYTPPGGVSVTYDLEAINLTDLPQRGVQLRQFHGEATVSFEVKPYGRLAAVNIGGYLDYALSLDPAILLPLGTTAPLTDLSGNARNGTAQGGLTAGGVTPGPFAVGDDGATNFDGTNDYVSTTYTTRRNMVPNPRFAIDTTGWSTAPFYYLSAGAVLSRVLPAEEQTGPYVGRVVCDGTNSAQGMSAAFTGQTFTAGVQYTLRTRLFGDSPARNLQLFFGRAGADHSAVTVTNNWADWQDVSVSWTPATTVTDVHGGINTLFSDPPQACTIYTTGWICEVGSSPGTYFDGSGGVTTGYGTWETYTGQGGWLGTAHNSASDVGCFSNGVARTFTGWANIESGGYVGLMGGSNNGVSGISLRKVAGGDDIEFFPDQLSVTNVWTGAFTDIGSWFHWALVFDEPASTAALYINGALVSSQAQTAQFPTGSFLEIGAWAEAETLDGKMAPVAVYEYGLTADEVADLYGAGAALWILNGPIDDFPVMEVPGQISALGELTLTDTSTVARNLVEVGVQHDYDPDNPEPLLLQAVTNLTALGGSSNTRAASYSTNIIRAALTTSPVAVCKAASQPHKGKWKVRARVYPSATTVRVRLAWRAGDGPFAKEKWVAVPNSAGWYDLDLGTVNIKELPSGHTCEFRIEAKATSGVPTVDVDIVELIPADNYTKLRGSSTTDSTGAFLGVDDFSTQTAGAVAGKTPLLSTGNWSGAGDATDFQVNATEHNIYRDAAVDSALNNGRYLRCGTAVAAAMTLLVDVTMPDIHFSGRAGAFIRYVDTSNWLGAFYTSQVGITLIKRVAGTETVLGVFADYSGSVPFIGTRTLQISVDATGNAAVLEGPKGGTLTWRFLVLADSNLATAGALDDGGFGIYDADLGTNDARVYDNFSVQSSGVSSTIVNPAINSGYGLDLTHETSLTASSTSTGTTPIRQGKYLTLPPSTRNGSASRIVVRARRDDGDLGFADSGLSDILTATLSVTPRVHLTGQ
jgi:hypothetical protein